MGSKNVWSTPLAISNGDKNASLSKITLGNEGDYSIIWQRADGLNTRIQTRTYDADTDAWTPIMTLSDGGSDAFHSDVSYDGSDQLSAIWVRKNGSYYIPEVKTLSSNPFITETTIAKDNTSISLSFNKTVYSTNAGSGSLETSDFALSITGGTATLASATPISISSSGNTYTLGISITGVPSGDEVLTVVPAVSNAIYDSTGNAASTTQSSNSIALNDNTAPTASLTYTIGGSIVSNVTENDVVIITATFSKTMKDSPVVQLSGSGAISMAANNMTKNSSTSYTYTWTVGAGDGTQTFALGTGTDSTDNVISSTPTSGASITMYIKPTASLAYAIGGSSVNTVKQGDEVTITATFSEALADSPVVQVSGSGVKSITATDMTKVSTTSYTYSWTVGTGDGTQTFALATGTDAEGDVITATPTSGATITVDNTVPTASLVYAIGGSSVSTVKQGDEVTITATFSEALADSPVVQVSGSGVKSITATDMTKVSSTSYTYSWTVGSGDGTQTFALATGTDAGGNVITATPTSGATITVDNTAPTAVLTLTDVGFVVSSYNSINSSNRVITATFSEAMADSPIVQIVGSGFQSIGASAMTKVNSSTYTYNWGNNFDEDPSTQTFALATGTDVAGNLVVATPTSGATFTVNMDPTAALTYTIDGSSVGAVKQGDVVTITANFNERMWDSPVAQISGSGPNSITATDMNKVSETSYTYSWTVGTGVGTQTFALHEAKDRSYSLITSTPTSGATITVYNTIVPEITLTGDATISLELGTAYTDAGATALDDTDGDITANIATVNPVDVNTVGTYTVTYNVSNTAGNAATQVTRTVHVTANVWDGSTDSDWNTAANWSLNSVPSTTAKIRVPKTGITNFPTASVAVTINSAYIESGATLIAQSTFAGTVTYERNLAAVDKWYLVSSPVSEQTIVDLISNHTFAIGTEGRIGIATYNNSKLSWDYLTLTSTGTLTSGVGYSTRLDAAGNISFTGTMPVTDIGIAIPTNTNGFNLVGNPYPSYIAANNDANTTNNLLKVNNDYLTEATIWLWNQATSSYDQINQIDNTHIAPGQGFFVNSNGNHTFSITEAMQSHQGTGTFQKSTNVRPEVQLILTNGTKIRHAEIFYIDGTTTGFDNGYDSSIFGGSSHSFAVYTQAVANGTGRKLGTQSLPNTDLESMVIPVGVIAAVNVEITFSAEALNLPDGIKVFLEDRSTNTFTRLDEVNSKYKVTLSEGASETGRFYIHTTSSVLNTTEITLKNISIYKTNSSTLRIVGLSQGKSTFKLFDVLGKQVVHITFESDGVSDIILPKLSAGIYIVQLENEAGKLNKKIVLN
jgi:hypothetical protein